MAHDLQHISERDHAPYQSDLPGCCHGQATLQDNHSMILGMVLLLMTVRMERWVNGVVFGGMVVS